MALLCVTSGDKNVNSVTLLIKKSHVLVHCHQIGEIITFQREFFPSSHSGFHVPGEIVFRVSSYRKISSSFSHCVGMLCDREATLLEGMVEVCET